MIKKSLTRAEEQIMQYLWEIESGFLKDIVEKFPEPKPAYTTVSTVIRVLVKKEFIGYRTYGKTNEYYPRISKPEYFKQAVKPAISNYLEGTPAVFTSFFSNAKLNLSELEEIKKLVDDRIKKLKARKK
jgi:BlaI family transcriptional regulator, penicillinase repressor